MSITDVMGTDRHMSEILPSAEESSTKVAEDQPQEEGSDEKQQNQSWITPNKSTLLSQGIAVEVVRSLEASEDYALHYLTRSVVKMMDNIGFSTCHESVVNILTDLCRRYMQKLWVDSKVFAEHAGRRYPIFEDANMVFGKLMFSAAELHAFMKQVEHDPFENDVPLFPVRKPSPNLLSIYGPVSDKELATRPEHIPRYFPAMHPEWCFEQIGVRAVEVSAVKSAVQGPAKNNKCIPRGRVSKSKISFPDFSGSTAKELGFVRPQKLPPKKVVEEPSGISSSANIAALQITSSATSSASKTKFRKCSMNESTSSSKSVDEHVKAESPKDKDAPDNKPFTQRSIGMFGMPPSALVHTESVMSEKMKKKRKKDKDRDKDRTKEKKIKHRDKLTDENEENPSTSSLISLSTESLTYGKSSTSSSSSIITKTDDQVKKLANQQQDVLPVLQKQPSSSEHDQIMRKMVDLKSITNKEPLTDVHFSHALSGSGGKDVVVCGKEENANKFKNDQPMDLRINDGHSVSGVGSQMAEILMPQQSTNRVGVVEEDRINDGSKNKMELMMAVKKSKTVEKTKEGVKDETQKNGERDASKSTLVENVRGKLEKRKFGEKSNEWRKVPKKTAADSSLSMVVDNIIKSSTTDDSPMSQDLKALKVVLSRTTGQKVFTASPSSDIERVVKDVEQKYDAGNIQSSASIAIDEPQVAGNICEKKKKHKKEKDRDKHHNKEHKRKDKRKYKEHKKSKTKDKEKKYIKLRPEKLCFKRSDEHIPCDEMPAPKIPKLKIRFGSNSSGVSASSSGIISTTSPTILTSTLSSLKSSEKDLPSLIDQNIQVTQPSVKVEDVAATSPYASLKSDGNTRPRKRQPVTKAELKALPKLPLKARTCGTKEGSGFTGGQGSAEVAVNPAISKADAGFEQRNYIQQLAGKHLRMDDRKKDIYSAAAFSSAEKLPKVTGKERNSESGNQGMMAKCDMKSVGQPASTNSVNTFSTDERRQEKESSKRDLEEVLKKKPDQVYAEADELDIVKVKLGKEKDPLKRVCDSNLVFNDRSSGKLKSKEPEKEKKKERQHYSLEKAKKNGREKGTHHTQNAHDKERDQTKRDEKSLGMTDEKKEAVQDRQKEKGNDESDRGRGKKTGIVGIKSGDISGGCTAENDKKHREKIGKVTGFGERRKRKGTDKDEESGKDVEKDAKGHAKEKGCSSETKDRGKYHSKKIDLEEKVRGHDKELKDKEKRTKHSCGRGKEHSTGKSSKEVEKISSGEEEEFSASRHAKTKNSGKDGHIGDPNNAHLPHNPLLKTEQVIFAKEQLSKRCSADSDVPGNRSPTAGSLTKSSDKKSAALDSDDSLDNMWICPECSVAYVEGATDMVGCDACDNWFHWSCVGLLVAPPDDAPWYCQNCAKKKLKKKSLLKSSTSKKSKK